MLECRTRVLPKHSESIFFGKFQVYFESRLLFFPFKSLFEVVFVHTIVQFEYSINNIVVLLISFILDWKLHHNLSQGVGLKWSYVLLEHALGEVHQVNKLRQEFWRGTIIQLCFVYQRSCPSSIDAFEAFLIFLSSWRSGSISLVVWLEWFDESWIQLS